MNAKNFLFTAAGIFLLVAAYSLGAREASASFVDHAAPLIRAYESLNVLRSDGERWGWSERDGGWIRITSDSEAPLPVSLDEVAFWEPGSFITKEGALWRIDPHSGPPRQWVNLGQLPIPVVSVETKSIGAVKGIYQR